MKQLKVIETLNGHSGAAISPVWLIANDPEVSIVCKGTTTLTFFGKEATSVASGGKILVRESFRTSPSPPRGEVLRLSEELTVQHPLNPLQTGLRALLQCALPNPDDSPAGRTQRFGIPLVSALIADYFFTPQLCVQLRFEVFATFMAMPKAAIYKDSKF
jgi:hypothetical protein